jgi:cbb3-type cytochrome oxidase cytochrome c subunit
MNKTLTILLVGLYSVTAQAYTYPENHPRYIPPTYQIILPESRLPSYENLAKWPADCARKTEQLEALQYIQRIKNFNPDPDQLNESDRNYNSRLKAIIWWYALYCSK